MGGYIPDHSFYNLYNLCYISIAFIALLSAMALDVKRSKFPRKFFQNIVRFFIVCFVLLAGLREYDVGADTLMYYYQWLYDIPYESISEIVFYLLVRLTKYWELSFTVFLLIVAAIFYFFMAKGITKVATYYNANIFYVFLSLISLFFMSSMSINIIRQGISLAFLFCFFSMWLSGIKSRIKYLLLALSFLAHTTAVIPILFFFGIYYWGRKISIYYFIALYLLGVSLALMNVGLLNIAPFITDILGANSRRATYLTDKTDLYRTGFKPQFVVFNTVFLFLGLYIRRQKYMIENQWQEKHTLLLKYFITSSFLFFMAFQIPYSDRWGLFSWICIPILTAPLFSEAKHSIRYKTLVVIFFILIYAFFEIYRILKQDI